MNYKKAKVEIVFFDESRFMTGSPQGHYQGEVLPNGTVPGLGIRDCQTVRVSDWSGSYWRIYCGTVTFGNGNTGSGASIACPSFV